MVIGPGCAKARQCIVPKTGKRSRPVWAALTPAFPPVLSPGFEPGLDASLAHCLYRLGYESMRRQSAGICPRSPLWIRPLVPNPALMLAVDAHTATRGMTGITGAEPPCSTETVPTSCGSADKERGRPRSRKPFPHWADRLYRIRTNPSDRELFASSTHRMMGAGDGPRVRRTNGDVDHRTRPAWS